MLMELRPIGQPSKGVVARHIGDLCLGAPPLSDILVGRHPAAAGHGCVYH